MNYIKGSIVLAMTLLVSCLPAGRDRNSTADSGKGDILVGEYGSMTGPQATFGQSTHNGIMLAMDEINAAGGVNNRKIRVITEDDQSKAEEAANAVTKLISQNNVIGVLGEVASSSSLAAAPICQSNKVPMITPSSTNERVTQVGDYIFRVCFIDPFQGEVMAKFAINTLKAKTAAVLTDVNSDYSRGLDQFFTDKFTKMGGRIVEKQSYTQTDQDFSGQMTAIRSANPDVIYVPGYYGQVGVIAKQAKQLGIKAPLMGGDGWDAPQLFQLGGEALNGSFFSNHYSYEDPRPEVKAFVDAYRARYNAIPDAIAALGYDAMKVLADAIKRAAATDGQKLRDAIAQTANFQGVTGTISINQERNAVKPATVFELQSGKYVFKENIYPEGMTPPASATGSPANTNTANANTAGAGNSNTAPSPAAANANTANTANTR